MNIWTRSGMSVGLVAIFYIGTAELLQATPFYEENRWNLCGAMIIGGGAALAMGRWLNQRSRRRYLASQQELPAEDRDLDSRHWQPFLLFNLAYWGVMMVVFGCLLGFVVPTPAGPEPSKVVARPTTNQTVKIPKFHLQGIVLREPSPSALINGRTYFLGDSIGEAELVSIETNAAVLEWRGIKVVLPAPQ